MAKEQEEQVYYVGIKDPIGIRRALLESSKDVVQYLQRAERFKETRNEKAEQIAKLKGIIHGLNSLSKKLKSALPKTKIRAKLHKHEQEVLKETINQKKTKIEEKKEKIEASAEKPKSMTELEKLEAELGEIESRLGNVG